MALTRAQINQLSDNRRGIKNKAFKLHVDDIELIKSLAKDYDMSEARLVVEAIKFYRDNK